ncbi:wall-associated receptor kinase-like 1 [Punica granatum]|uniref:Wall-associated receptor kinase-like 1 n=2 Tax=Punica granatum TaxID=22663 RepID=A0A6P8CF09_PUNGR|nr:wall-associated receptor kinase-like 1 [Punica granatum]
MYILMEKRREAKLKEKFFKRIGGLIMQRLSSPDGNVEKSKLFNSKELEMATDHFNQDRILGKGGQGTVYKGMLADGMIVAVKKSISIDEKNVEPFINEVVILSQINHRNIVKLLGCCLESEVPLLVYEFIPNGTLYQYLHDPEFPFSWDARLRIATEVASALFYLHSFACIPIYHRDIKSSNILLDEKYRAKVADFGTSRSGALDQTHVTTLVQGTFGYLDPEYFQTGQFTEKSDVYSFGIVLVELLTGQKPTTSLLGETCIGLASSFITAMEEDHLFEILDPRVREEGGEEEIIVVANLAKRCLNLKGRERPSMKDLVIELEGIRKRSEPSSSLAQHQEEVDHADPNEFEADDDLSISRRSGADLGSIRLSDGRALLTRVTW